MWDWSELWQYLDIGNCRNVKFVGIRRNFSTCRKMRKMSEYVDICGNVGISQIKSVEILGMSEFVSHCRKRCEFAGISRNLYSSVGIWRNLSNYDGICRTIMEFVCLCETLGNQSEFLRICWNMWKFVGLSPTLSEFVWIYWNLSQCRNLSEFVGIYVNMSDFVEICLNV